MIRLLQKGDNDEVAHIIRKVLGDFGAPTDGTALGDAALDSMFEVYSAPKSVYFVAVEENRVLGGGGIAPLEGYPGNICELQKMYFLQEGRGRGLGAKLLQRCLDTARNLGFEACYLETMSGMRDAQKLYQGFGFEYIDGPMGETGHYSCGVWMLKPLTPLQS